MNACDFEVKSCALEANNHIQSVDAAWMNLAGVVTPSANVSSEEVQQAVHRVEQARAEAGLLPLKDIADVGAFVLQ